MQNILGHLRPLNILKGSSSLCVKEYNKYFCKNIYTSRCQHKYNSAQAERKIFAFFFRSMLKLIIWLGGIYKTQMFEKKMTKNGELVDR